MLASVHAFSEGGVGSWLLAFFAVIVGSTVALVFWRGDRLRSPGRIDSPLSREGAFLANNLVFAAFSFMILLGTVFPLFVEALEDRRISVGVPYFERMSMPIGLTLLFLMAVAPLLPWRKTTGEVLRDRIEWPAWFAVATLVFAVLVGARGLLALLGFTMAGFAGGAAIRQLALSVRRQGWGGFLGRANGGMIVHLGVVMMAAALVASSTYVRQAEVALEVGDSVSVGGVEVTYVGFREETHPNRVSDVVVLEVDGQTLEPALERFVATGMVVPAPQTRSTLAADIQTSVIEAPTETGRVVVRITRQPMIVWLWIGGLVMLAGTALAAMPRRRRGTGAPPASAPGAAAPPADRPAPAEVGA